MSEYIFVTNIFEYSNIRIYSSHSVSHFHFHTFTFTLSLLHFPQPTSSPVPPKNAFRSVRKKNSKTFKWDIFVRCSFPCHHHFQHHHHHLFCHRYHHHQCHHHHHDNHLRKSQLEGARQEAERILSDRKKDEVNGHDYDEDDGEDDNDDDDAMQCNAMVGKKRKSEWMMFGLRGVDQYNYIIIIIIIIRGARRWRWRERR